VLLTKYPGDQIKKNDMGGACGTYGGEGMCIKCRELLGNLGKRSHSEDLSVDERLILEWVSKKSVARDWGDLVLDRHS
jgi:hypothetical protein